MNLILRLVLWNGFRAQRLCIWRNASRRPVTVRVRHTHVSLIAAKRLKISSNFSVDLVDPSF